MNWRMAENKEIKSEKILIKKLFKPNGFVSLKTRERVFGEKMRSMLF